MIKTLWNSTADYFRKTDKWLWILTLAASVSGFILIASQQRNGGTNFLQTQMIAAVLGYTAAVLLSLTDYHFLADHWKETGGFALLLTAAVFFIGIRITGTDDVGWIRLPFGVTFQPSELTKICFILTFSRHIAYLDEEERLHTFLGVVTLTLHAAVPVGLIHLQGDDGAALVFALMFLIMSFAAGVQLRYFIILLVTALAAVPLLWFSVLNHDQKNRLLVLFSADDSALKTFGWQQYQGKISIASGGIWGKGLFSGTRTGEGIVPYQENDFIFTTAGEETGFVGCTAILLLLLLLLYRVLHIAVRADNPLGKSICIGFFALAGSQAFINLGMVLGLLPVIGVTLPFFSAGGTSAACLYLGIGLVQSVRMHPSEPKIHLPPVKKQAVRRPICRPRSR